MTDSVYLVGMGAVGSSLAVSLGRAGIEVVGVCERDVERARSSREQTGIQADPVLERGRVSEADVVIVAVGDGDVTSVATEVAACGACDPGQVWLHCSGALPAGALDPLRGHVAGIGSIHPALVFPPGTCRMIGPGGRFAVDGDPIAMRISRRLVDSLGGVAVEIEPGSRPAYHAGLVFCSNYLVVLMERAKRILADAGISAVDVEPMVTGLARSAIDAATSNGIEESLSGPVRRGDAEAVRRHLDALAGDLSTRSLYAALASSALDMCRGLGEVDGDRLEEVAAAIEDAMSGDPHEG